MMLALTTERLQRVRWSGGLGRLSRYRHAGGAKCQQWTDGAKVRRLRKEKRRAKKALEKKSSSLADLVAAFRA